MRRAHWETRGWASRERAAAELVHCDGQNDRGTDRGSAGGTGGNLPLIGAGRGVKQVRGWRLRNGASTAAARDAEGADTRKNQQCEIGQLAATAIGPHS